MNCQFLKIVVVCKCKKNKKRREKLFKNIGLDVIIEGNMKIINYLDITFNLNSDTCRPYQKTG